MNSDETVEQVADKVFKLIQISREKDCKYGYLWAEGALQLRRVVEANAEDYCTRFLAANKRELAGKDAEIAKLRALVKEMADVAEGFVLCKATDCETICKGDERCLHRRTIALVSKAREVVK